MTRMRWHYTPCRGSGGDGGGGVVVLIIAAALIIAAIARPVAHAADAVARVVAEVLEIAGIVLVSAAGLAVLAGMAYGAVRIHSHIRTRQALSRHSPVTLSASQGDSGPRPAVAPRHVINGTGLVDRDEISERN
jgi:hypothetical protein